METVITGRVWKFGDSLSTDLLVPGSKVLANPGISKEGAAKFCMSANRPGWAENEVKAGDIVIGGTNFGCGSSRNGSEPLKTLGVGVVLAESVARIHLRNAVNTGLPTLIAPGIMQFAEEGERLQVDIVSGEVKNLNTGAVMQAQPWPEDSPPFQILMEGGLNNYMKRKVREAGLVSTDSIA